MADEILYIDADEEITSVIDKLKACEAETVILVVPKGASLLQSLINLKLLKREAEPLGKKIALVTADRVGRNLALQIDIPVYEDVESRQPVVTSARLGRPPVEDLVEVDMSEKGEPPVEVHHYLEKRRLAPSEKSLVIPLTSRFSKKGFLIGALIFLVSLGGLIFLYPKTRVVLGVASEPYEASLELTIDKNIIEINENSSLLPGVELVVEKEKEVTATASGKKTIGEKAKGPVVFYNCNKAAAVTLSAGTLLASTGKQFVTQEQVSIPGGTFLGTTCTAAGKSAPVNIEAKAVGSEANLSTGSTFSVEGYPATGSSDYLIANNETALQGGSSREVTFLREEDIERAAEMAKDELSLAAEAELEEKAQEGGWRILETAYDRLVVEKKSDKAAGTETNDAQVVTKVKVRTLAFNEEAYRKLIVSLLSLRLPEGKRLVLSAQDEIATTVTETNWDQGFLKIKGAVKTRTINEMKETDIKHLIRNTSLGTAERRLRELPRVVTVSLEATPRFINRTALIDRNIIVVIEAQ
jgi:hypothetical protein